MIHDYREMGEPARLDCDVAIVGSGPAGLAIALELAKTNLRTIVLETGGDAHDATAEALSAFENVGQKRAPAFAVRRRIFGGTSIVWSGRCVPFSAMDFEARDWIAHSGWPIGLADVQPYWERAAQLLGIGPAVFDERVWSLVGRRPPADDWDASKFVLEVFQQSRAWHAAWRSVPSADPGDAGSLGALQHSGAPAAADIGEVARPILVASRNVDVWLHAHALEVLSEGGGRRATGVRLHRRDGSPGEVRARRVVLACGGIDNARLLLLSGPAHQRGLGNRYDQVGRYLMDHHYCPLGSIREGQAVKLRRRLSYKWFDAHGRRHLYLTGLSLSPRQQAEQRLLRGALYPFEHVQAAAALTRAADVARRLKRGEAGPSDIPELLGAVAHPWNLMRDLADRFVARRPSLARLSRLDIGCNVEQLPDPDSRVTLGEERDSLGQRRARIDWRVHDEERRTYQVCATLFRDECLRLGLEPPTLTPWLMDNRVDWREFVHDMAHPMSTTRMSADPRRGVVDRHCAVHGVDDLFVAGSSVFSTGGTANPTFMLTALALRLADHLRENLKRPPAPFVPEHRVEESAEPAFG